MKQLMIGICLLVISGFSFAQIKTQPKTGEQHAKEARRYFARLIVLSGDDKPEFSPASAGYDQYRENIYH